MIMEPTRFCLKMFRRFVEAAVESGWTVRKSEENATFWATKPNGTLKVVFGAQGHFTEVKFANQDIPVGAAAGLVPLLLGMQGV
jgi:hypothetical protein